MLSFPNKIERFKRVNEFHRTAEELREFTKENNIKLLQLLEYLRRKRNVTTSK